MSAMGDFLITLIENAQDGDQESRRILIDEGYGSVVSPCFDAAIAYRQRFRWAVIPQCPGTKRPYVRWKIFKDELRKPSVDQLLEWYNKWPDAGVIVLLGPVSGLFAVDVDGEEAHRALLKHLGGIPKAPSSWRGKEYRYHLLFRHPANLTTNARFTPWHPQLEFRGHGGYIVLPPSQHVSGHPYRWKPGRSIDDLPLPEIPKPILQALKERARRQRRSYASEGNDVGRELKPQINLISGLANSTRVFLSGKFANADGWNDRLFKAACDMAGNRVNKALATEMLLAAAAPWNEAEKRAALATIESAYSERRVPARSFLKTTRMLPPTAGGDSQPQRITIKVEP